MSAGYRAMAVRRAWLQGLKYLDSSLTALSLAAVAAAYLLYILNTDLLMTAGQASDVLAGFEMLRQKTFLLKDWVYSSEVFTLRSPLFVAFSALFTDSVIWAHRLSVVFELAAECAALAYMLRRLGLRGRPGLLAAALFFGARSYQSGMFCGMGFSQDASFLTAFFLTLGYCAAVRQGIRGKAERILKFALPPAAFLFGLSSGALFILLYLPVLACCAYRAAPVFGKSPAGGAPGPRPQAGQAETGAAETAEGPGKSDPAARNAGAAEGAAEAAPGARNGAGSGKAARRGKAAPQAPETALLKEAALWAVLCLAGYLLLTVTVAVHGMGPALVTAVPSAGFREAAAANLPALLGAFVDGTPLLFIKGVALIRSWGWVAGWSFLFFMGYAAYMTPRAAREAEGPCGEAIRTALACLFSAFVFTVVHLRAPLVTDRHLLFLYPYAAILLAWLYRSLARVNPGLSRLLLACIAFTVATNSVNAVTTLDLQAEIAPSRATNKHIAAIEEILSGRGVRRVYALYWDSYNLEALSDGRLKAAAVDGRMRPYLSNASLLNYDESTAGEKAAFVLSVAPRPWAPANLNLQDGSLLETAEETFRIDDPENPVIVSVFSRNPFTFAASAERALSASLEEGGLGGPWLDPEPAGPAGQGGAGPAGASGPAAGEPGTAAPGTSPAAAGGPEAGAEGAAAPGTGRPPSVAEAGRAPEAGGAGGSSDEGPGGASGGSSGGKSRVGEPSEPPVPAPAPSEGR
ncbi:MAG: hypothetical protein LBW85_00075 [Deltaproteobacteria bacterium]|jgi:hypothetical protein|nr:hypothetical protein [Deltaproteobacteria bacterium]